MARASQASLEWGGFPTVMSVAVGIFAARLLWQQVHGPSWRLSLASGAASAAIPLIHGVGGGTWLYCAGPWIALAALTQAGDRLATLRGLLVSGLLAAAFLAVYRGAGPIDVQGREMDWTHAWQQESAPLGDAAWLGAFDYVRKDSGSVIVLAGWAACGVLAMHRQWLAALLIGSAWLALATVVANSHWWVLPGSFLLYPERAIYWVAPLSAVGVALAWRASPFKTLLSPGAGVSVVLLGLAALQHNLYYQKVARSEYIGADGWEALVWARQNLQPTRDFVQAPYNTTGSFLPAVAQVACSGAHHHHFLERQAQAMCQRRTITHVLVDQARSPSSALPAGKVVLRNRMITIVAIESVTIGRGS
jgi:hypothetical protein